MSIECMKRGKNSFFFVEKKLIKYVFSSCLSEKMNVLIYVENNALNLE